MARMPPDFLSVKSIVFRDKQMPPGFTVPDINSNASNR
jgi:hypothetical protein